MAKTAGSWKKGMSGNPKGRPENPVIQEMRAALVAAQKGKKRTLLEHFFERAYKDNHVLIAAIKKLLPDLSNVELQAQAEKFRIIIKQ
ncbi:MAG: DUF5681 domain-containing protein [bacterium]|nr:DUF5681 domain-containing protein [bacterium]